MRSRLRKLHIDEQEYTWMAQIRAASGPDGRRHRCIRIRVWGAGRTGCALQADLTVRRQPVVAEEDAYPYPAAADVRALIDYGLRAGWKPQFRGGTFQVASAANMALPGFVVTDVAWPGERHP
ncbi:integrase [Dactylosporangium sp. NPDC049742]|uniref:integrase n=1 Tax=Dactylosporangium sp. NPDC049742 TaxID=3154737 RepID=UPI00342CF18A